jgi:hypothetical protein
MNSGLRTVMLFVFPVIAVFACAALSFSVPAPRPYLQARPQFLDIIDRLGVSTENPGSSLASERIRNVFTHDEPEKKDAAPVDPPAAKPALPVEKHADHAPVWVSMIMDGGENSFSVINGQKMRIGDRADSFTLKAIRKGSVTIRHSDGIEETIHVKAF